MHIGLSLGRLSIAIFLLFTSFDSEAWACPEAKAGAWYVAGPRDIDALEAKSFNLFFLVFSREGMTNTEKGVEIQAALASLDACSQLVLPIDDLVAVNWYANEGMQAFVYTWGTHPKVYGFLLRDDVLTAPFPSNEHVDPNALWIYRWYYKMIRNTAEDQSNSYFRDLAPGKKVIVTIAFDPSGKNAVGPHYLSINYSLPPDFLTPGAAWDMAIPYWYPHRRQISENNENYLMDLLYSDMAQTLPLCATIPMIQTASQPEPQPLTEANYYSMEADGLHAYDLTTQYNRLERLMSCSKTVVYYSANGHAQITHNLLHWNSEYNVSPENVFYVQSGIMNAQHLSHTWP